MLLLLLSAAEVIYERRLTGENLCVCVCTSADASVGLCVCWVCVFISVCSSGMTDQQLFELRTWEAGRGETCCNPSTLPHIPLPVSPLCLSPNSL